MLYKTLMQTHDLKFTLKYYAYVLGSLKLFKLKTEGQMI